MKRRLVKWTAPLLASLLSGCLGVAPGQGECEPGGWQTALEPGGRASYDLAESQVELVVGEKTLVADGLGNLRTVVPVNATRTDAEYTLREVHFVDVATGLVIRRDVQETATSPWFSTYLQPTPDSLLFDSLWGSAAYLQGIWLSRLARGNPVLQAGWNVTATHVATNTGLRLEIAFSQQEKPDGDSTVRGTWIDYDCGVFWPRSFDMLIGLGNGFDRATLVSTQIGHDRVDVGGESWAAWQLHAEAALANGSMGPTFAHPDVVGTLDEAVAAARLAPQFVANWAPAHPDHFVAAAYYESSPIGKTWTIQFAQVDGERSYETTVERHDVTVLVVDANGAPIFQVVSEEPSRNPIIAEYPEQFRASHGTATLDHALRAAIPEVGPDFALALKFNMEALRWPSALEVLLHVYSATNGKIWTYSGVTGQLLYVGTLGSATA